MLLNTFIANNAVGAGGGGTPATFNDTFSYTENPISNGGAWASPLGVLGAIRATGAYCYGAASSGNDQIARVVTPTFAADQIATITIQATPENIGPTVRTDANGNCYNVSLDNSTTVHIYKISANGATFTGMGAPATITITAVAAGDTIGLSASGTSTVTLTIYRNGISVGTRTDSSSPYTSGQPGIEIFDTNTAYAITTFQADDL